ncbi:MAG: histidinol-phosphatase [Bacteroidales bacterium]|jgi:histidinol-phosphatase (PHP family)|nr:histidinol-phosphatase [Bacteroidales bacterium]
MIYKTDYHIHTFYSDGKSAPEDYIVTAVAAGLKEIGFSDHLTLFRAREPWTMDVSELGKYLGHLKSLRNSCNEIKIKTGLEVDFFPGKEKELGEFLSPLKVDYLIGSVHYMGDSTVDLGPEFYEGKDYNKIFEAYFDIVIEAVSSELFDIIGHCDLIRLFGYETDINPEPLYRKLASSMRQHNVAFEINTNGRNRPLGDFFPDKKLLHVFCDENVPVCVNSDAHINSRTAQYFDEAYDLLRDTGFTEMAVFENRRRTMVPFRSEA